MKNIYLLLLTCVLSAGSAFGQCSDLFFSEYVEGSGNTKALEIYNPSGAMVDLNDYVVYRYQNGSPTASDSLFPQGMLAAGDVFVVGNPFGDTTLLALSDTTEDIVFFGGDDAVALINRTNGDTLDIIGIVGQDPGTAWTVGTGSTQNFTLVRDSSVQEGTTNWALSANQWIVLPINTLDSLQSHYMTPCPGPTGPGCSNDIFFSEYIEGSGNNKSLELYNPMDTAVDLSNYTIYRYNNGGTGTPSGTFTGLGMLNPGEVYVISNPSSDTAILAVSDTTHSITFYNGDDYLLLVNTTTGDSLDGIGVYGQDPGASWPVGTGGTANFTLVRMMSVQEGTIDWTVGVNQWDVYPIDMSDSLGMHTMTPCGVINPPMDPEVSFLGAQMTVNEGVGTAMVSLFITNVDSTNPTSVDVNLTAMGTATSGTDFTFASPVTVTFPAGNGANQMVSIAITDDMMPEGTETIVLELVNPTNNATIGGSGMFTVNIEDNDFPTYPIGTINTVDSLGSGDSTGVTCWIGGIVYGVNLRPSGLQFTIIDNTGGIGVFDFNQISGYTVTESDSISILGTVGQFNGLLQIDPDSIIVHGTGFTLKQATPVTGLGEVTESDLVVFENAYLIDPAQWTGSGSGFNLDVTNGTDTIVVRIDADVDAYSLPAPTGTFNVCGLGGQFDSSSPFDSGYQLLPRYKEDFKLQLEVNLGPDTTTCDSMVMLDAGPAPSYMWSTGDTTQMVTVAAGGTYSVTISDNVYGGSASDTIEVIQAGQTVADFGCDTLFVNAYQFNDSSDNATSWMWDFGDGATSTMQNPSHTYTAQGIYTVTLIATGPCGSDTIVKTLDTQVGIAEALAASIRVYPNPSEGQFAIELPQGQLDGVAIRVMDVYGKVVRVLHTDQQVLRIDLNEAAAGVYFLEVNLKEGRAIKRIVLR